MTEYRYDNVQITDLPLVACKIGYTVGVFPVGLTDNGNTTTVLFSSDLTAGQKTQLDSVMTAPTVDSLPTTTNTAYAINDFFGLRGTLASSGITSVIYPRSDGSWTIQFNKTLTNSEKTTVKNAFGALLVQL